MTDLVRTKQILEQEEARIPYAYQDSRGYWTIGIGHLIDKRLGGGIDNDVIDMLLERDIAEKWSEVTVRWPWMNSLDDARQFVFLSVAFQVGTQGLAAFHLMLGAASTGNWDEAANQLLDSDLGRRDAPARAHRLAEQLRTGVWVSFFQKA